MKNQTYIVRIYEQVFHTIEIEARDTYDAVTRGEKLFLSDKDRTPWCIDIRDRDVVAWKKEPKR